MDWEKKVKNKRISERQRRLKKIMGPIMKKGTKLNKYLQKIKKTNTRKISVKQN